MIDNEIVTQAIEYILLSVWDGVTLEEVAAHLHMSVSRFSEIFKKQTGQSVYAFIKRIKMEQSAMKLKMEPSRSITEIAGDYGYSASNYSSAFSQYHKKSPSVFRNEVVRDPEEVKEVIAAIDAKIRIEMKPDYVVMYERTIGNYQDMKTAWCRFIEKYQQDIDESTIFFERTFDDPTIAKVDNCIYDICMTVKNTDKYKNTCVLKGGKFVVYPFKGYLSEIYSLHQKLVGIWFPAKPYELDERYAYDQYYKVEANDYMEFDICIPIK
ncbi:MAG: AraC family transcriptional regulator [Cellulosilyticum sp.]|nr:AraC family transcriptional regulator [Cellulosilyticum sp.]